MALQVLPAIDLRGGQCVRLKQGDYNQETIFSNAPGEMARKWSDGGGDILHLVDLDGAKQGEPVNLDAIKAIRKSAQIPCELGGGIRTEESIDLVLNQLGIDRVIIGTKALKDPEWLCQMAEKYPNQLVLGIDAKDSHVATEGWLNVSSVSVMDLASQYRHLPLAGLIYTNIANDGMMQGIDNSTYEDFVSLAKLGFDVIASGGVSSLEDVAKLAKLHESEQKVSGAIIGRALYDEAFTLEQAVEAAKI